MDQTSLLKSDQIPRIFYADVLRFFAIIAVIMLHCSSDYVEQYGEISPGTWWAGAAYNGISRLCIPIFVMLSGAFLLKPAKMVTMKELFGKRLMKILVPLIFWSIIYIFWETPRTEEGWDGFDIKETIQGFFQGPVVYHFWFLYMMVGIYLIYPVINAFIGIAKDIDLKYFLILCFITNTLVFITEKLWDWSLGIDLQAFTGYIGYFVLGYYLNTRKFSIIQFRWFAFFFILGILLAIIMPWLLYQYNEDLVADFTESDFTPEVILAASGLFVSVKYLLQNYRPKKWIFRIINGISMESFGIYLIHVLVMEFVFSENRSYSPGLLANPAWGIPVQTIIILVVSYILVKLIRLVPVFNRVIG